MKTRVALVAILLMVAGPVAAQRTNPFGRSWLRVTGGADQVSNDYGDWRSVEARAAVAAGSRDLILAETRWQEAFGDRGTWAGIGLRHAFGSKWFATTSVGGGTGRFVLPDFRFDVSLHRKLLPADRLIAGVGFTAIRSKDVYRDRSVFGSLAYYFDGVVIEGGARINWSNPGAERSARGFGALTFGRAGQRRLVLRGNAGRESYQLLGTQPALRAFSSEEFGLEYEEWLGSRWSLILGGETYHNPFYRRTGGRLGVARHW